MGVEINENNFVKIIKPDSRRRVNLPKALVGEGVIYRLYSNDMGQIVLDPQVTIPASELWLFKNKKALAMLDKGMTEDRLIDRGSFAKHVKNVP